jgi:hypothetical protein
VTPQNKVASIEELANGIALALLVALLVALFCFACALAVRCGAILVHSFSQAALRQAFERNQAHTPATPAQRSIWRFNVRGQQETVGS